MQPQPDNNLTEHSEPQVTELDPSGYHHDLVLTYKMIEDIDDQDTLFRIQFLQAFGITDDEYHPEIVSTVIDSLYERFRENSGIRGILESHPLYLARSKKEGTGTGNGNDEDYDDAATTTDEEIENPASSNDNSEMIFCMMFSFQLFDLFHTCMRHAKHKEEIPAVVRDEIAECFRTMF
jgi:hypothetical protein